MWWEWAKMLDFSRFCRTRYRSGCLGGYARKCLFYKGFVDGIDMPFLASGDLLQNVNHAPSLAKIIL